MADNYNVLEDEKRKESRNPDTMFTDLEEDLEMEMMEGPGWYPVRG